MSEDPAPYNQPTCVLCEKLIERGENVVMIPQNQPVHRTCYDEAIGDPK